MTTKETFNKAIETQNYDLVTMEQLQELVQTFPYAAIFHQILLKKSQNTLQYENILKKAAIQSSNRAALFDFVFAELLQHTINKVEENLQTFEETVSKNPTDTTQLPESSQSQTNTQSQLPNENKKQLYQELEKEILSNAVHAAITIDAGSQVENENTLALNSEPTTVETSQSPQFTSFSSWLKQLTQQPDVNKQLNQQQLINQFIQNDPQITPKKTEFFSPINRSKLSL